MTVSRISGEVLCALGKKEYILKPTFGALMQVELKTETSILKLAADALEGQLKLSHALIILKCCMQEDVSEDVLSDMILEQGLAAVMPVVHSLMAVVLEGTLTLDD